MRRGEVLAVVQAGGQGTRMDVLTRERAKPALPFGGVGEASADVVARQLGEIRQNLRLRHAARQIAEDIANRNAGTSNARLAKSDGRIHSDSVEQVHHGSLR